MLIAVEKLPYFKLRGSREEIGEAHGRLLRERVAACFDYYSRRLMGPYDIDLEAKGAGYLEAVRRFRPDVALEMEAIAHGARMEPWQIGVLNARTELLLETTFAQQPQECTSLFFPQAAVLGQNWDWIDIYEELAVILEVELENGLNILMLTEPGILGKIGMNSAGLGVCLNILAGKNSQPAVPLHVLLRLLLEAGSMSEVETLLAETRFDAYSNIMVGTDEGHYLDVEITGNEAHRVDYGHELPLHTNHYLQGELRHLNINGLSESTTTRYRRARELCRGLRQENVDGMMHILGDKANDENAICRKYANYLGFPTGTVCSIVMDLPSRRMHITKGNPYENDYADYHLAG